MKSLIEMGGNTIRQIKINDGRLLMKDQFYSDPSYKDSFVVWEHGKKISELQSIQIKTFNEKYSAVNGFITKFNVLIDDVIPIGTVLYDTKKDIYYICGEYYDKDEIYGSGKMTRCNNWLKWKDDKGAVFNYPVFDINSTQYNSGESSAKTMTLGTAQHLITITADENTVILDHGKRFFSDKNKINPTVYKLTQNDTTSMNYGDKGVLKVTVTEDEYNPKTDSVEEWLCDYFISPIESDLTEKIEIDYSGLPQIRSGGNSKTFTAQTDSLVSWLVDLNKDQEDSIILTVDGNSCKIKCLSNEKLIGSSFTLRCTDGVNMGELEISIIGGV